MGDEPATGSANFFGPRQTARMVTRLLLVAAVVLILGAAWLRRDPEDDVRATQTARVAEVIDGDTIRLRGDDVVRLLQIDAPELNDGECYSRRSRAALAQLLPAGARVRLEADHRVSFLHGRSRLDADKVDRFGRRLAYVFRADENVNVTLVRRGAASVWFYDGKRGRYADELLNAARRAKGEGRGLWRACPGTELDPLSSVTTRRS